MRYAVQSKGLPLSEVEGQCRRVGAVNITVAVRSQQLFCEMDEAAATALAQVPGLAVKLVGRVSASAISQVPRMEQYIRLNPDYGAAEAVYGASQASLSSYFYELRESLSPPVTGSGSTVAILDSGIRSTHRSLKEKVVYAANFTSSPTPEDVFSHGTAVAFVCAGGRHALGEECGLAPGAKLMNIKVLEDDGEGTAESVVMGLEEVMELREAALAAGLPDTDPMCPNLVNLSLGMEDTGDPDDPLRVACQQAAAMGLPVIAAAGNSGPTPGTVLSPACDPEVFSAGVVTFVPFDIWQYSSRGPTVEGNIKPDVVFYGVDVLAAGAASDDAFEVKSGTSFASPFICGGASLVAEFSGVIIGRSVTREEMRAVISLICRKPEGAPADKDNIYGWGMPMGDLVLRTAGISPAAATTEMMVPIMAMGLMAAMTAGMRKAIR
jgi:serine protease AprX